MPKDSKPKYYRSGFNALAPFYDAFLKFISIFIGGEKKLRTKTIDKLNLKSGEKVLDVCCGTGTLSKIAAEKVGNKGQVTGIDLSENMLKGAKRKSRSNQEFILSNAENINLPANYFDKAYISFGLHEIPLSAQINTLKEIYKLLKNKGILLILDYSYPKNKFLRLLFRLFMVVEEETAWNFLKEDICLILKDNNFSDIKREIWYNGMIQIITGGKR